MSTSATFAAIAASNAAIAASAAAEAKRERCIAEVKTFDSRTGTLQEARSYADCINTLHPTELSGGSLVAAKALFVFAVLCAIAGGFITARGRYNDVMDVGVFSFLWFFMGPCILLCVLGLFYGIYWVIT